MANSNTGQLLTPGSRATCCPTCTADPEIPGRFDPDFGQIFTFTCHTPEDMNASQFQPVRTALARRRAPALLGLSLALLAATASAQAAATPLSLQQVLAQLPRSPQWQQSELTLEKARRNLEAARARVGLTVGLSGGLSSSTTFSDGSGSLTPTLGASASANVLPWSSAQDSVRAAERSLRTAEAQNNATRANLVLSAQQQYFAARLASFDRSVAQRTLELRQRQLAAANAQRELGNASQQTVLERTADFQEAQSTLAKAQQTLQQNTFALANTLGVALTNVAFSTAPQDPGEPADLNALIASALKNRSDVISAQQALASAQSELEAARRNRALPALTASVQYGQLGGNASGTSLGGSLNFKTGAASATFNPGLGGSTSAASLALSLSASFNLIDPAAEADIQSAQTNLQAAEIALGLARQGAELAVRQQHAALRSARAPLEAVRSSVAAAQAALDAVNARFAAGSATQTDVLAAEVNLLSAQRNYEQALETAQLALHALQNAQGLIPSLREPQP